jgi:hypothetical protein
VREAKLIGEPIKIAPLAVFRPRCDRYWVAIARKLSVLEQGTAWKVAKAEFPVGASFDAAIRGIRKSSQNLGFRICTRKTNNSLLVWKRDDDYSVDTHGQIIRRED